jgi:hypothetical protein
MLHVLTEMLDEYRKTDGRALSSVSLARKITTMLFPSRLAWGSWIGRSPRAPSPTCVLGPIYFSLPISIKDVSPSVFTMFHYL